MENWVKKYESSASSRHIPGIHRCTAADSSRRIRLKELKTRLQIGNNRDDQDIEVSDSESSSSGNGSGSRSPKEARAGLFVNMGLGKLGEEDNGYEVVKNAFLSSMGVHGNQANVVAIHKNLFFGLTGQARLRTFQIYADAMGKKCQSNGGNIKYAWYGCCRDKVGTIFTHGFTHCGEVENNGSYGYGIYLSPSNTCYNSAMSTASDEDGLRHVLLCRVILGNMEEVERGSRQFLPSSRIYDSGVDNLLSPKTYIVWSSNMNTHILPEYVISFKDTSYKTATPKIQEQKIQQSVVGPKSPWILFPVLISELAKYLPPDTIGVLRKYHNELKERKLTRLQLVHHLRGIVGDKLLRSVIESVRGKYQRNATSVTPSQAAVDNTTKGLTGICLKT